MWHNTPEHRQSLREKNRHMKRQSFLLLFITAAVALSLAACRSSQPVFKEVDATDAATIAAKRRIVVLDVRTPKEFSEGHLPNAINVDFLNPGFSDSMNKLDKTRQYLVYCRSGQRSTKAIEIMRLKGFKNVTHMLGGISKWPGSVVK